MAVPLAAPFVIAAARWAATRLIWRAAARAATPTLASRAALATRAASTSSAATTPIAQRLPVLGNVVRQPKLLGLKPVTAPAATRTGRVAQRVSPSRLTSPLWTQKMPLAKPVQIPGSTARVTARAMSAPERLGRTALSPVRAVGQMTSPRTLAGFGEVSAYSAGLGALNRRYGNDEAQTPETAIPVNTPAAPGMPAPSGPAPTAPTPLSPSSPTLPGPASPSGGGGMSSVISQDDANRAELQQNLDAIGASYNKTLNEIKKLYNLSETEEEKELLRFQLADLEAQVKSGQEAVQNLYGEKTANLQLMAARSRQEGAKSAEGMGSVYSGAATDLEALQEARRAAQVEEYRGLGIGAVPLDADYSGLLRTLAPVAQTSAQTIADIGAQGLDYLGGLSESMGAARVGELQSLGAARDASIRQAYMQQVLERINDDRAQMNQQIGSVLASRASSIASAVNNFRQSGGNPTVADIYEQLAVWADDGVPASDLGSFMQSFFPGQTLSPELLRQYQQWYDTASQIRGLASRQASAEAETAEQLLIEQQINTLLASGQAANANEAMAMILGQGSSR